ncbi:dTMP kinase [Helicobacter burdigaliensis]|uniref:dTMP kinase n=1 Tax=Helicobacter burdigaliensis TaxID=2315334 RepID=UPI000EF68963|nr:dTMP kinase [Helicobacter burdigaliensis]
MYVAIEGIDTCGKSTQIKALREVFKEAIFVNEPGGSELGSELREILLNKEVKISKRAEVLLFLADRAQLADEVLLKSKEKLVISDRSLVSGMAYAKDFDCTLLKELNLFALNGILPSKVVFLELSKEELKRRLDSKTHDKIEKRGIEYLLLLQERIKEVLEFLKLDYLIINADNKEEQITQEIISYIKCDA